MDSTLSLDVLRRSWRSWTSIDLEVEGPGWLQLVWSGLFAVMCALLFTAFGMVMMGRAHWDDPSHWWRWFQANLFVSAVIAYGIHGLFELLTRWIGPARIKAWPEGRRALFFVAVPLFGVATLWPTAVWLMGQGFGTGAVRVNMGFVAFALMFSLVMFLYFGGKARLEMANRRAAEAQLKLLQGQIEPHFLFNTLANVVGLIDHEPERARRMLESFIDYLRGSLGGLRNERHTLGQEMALVEAYLGVLAVRMEDRLRVRIEVPDSLRGTPLPAVLVQPLVENAIHHGLEPKVEGGEIVVHAQVQGDRLHIEVLDDGLGRPPAGAPARRSGGAGAALANIRERLAAAYGAAAGLTVTERAGGGVCARLTLPWPVPPTLS